MSSYELTYTFGIDQQKTLSELARRCRVINGWGEQELLQYAATANSKTEIEMKLQFLQEVVPLLEDKNKKETLKKQIRITEEEHLRCQKVADAFAELYSIDLLVLDAGIYGFVKLQYYHHPFGYNDTDIFTSGTDLFNDLWNEWLSTQLLSLAKGTPMADLDYQDILRCLPVEKQKELMERKDCFLERAGISL